MASLKSPGYRPKLYLLLSRFFSYPDDDAWADVGRILRSLLSDLDAMGRDGYPSSRVWRLIELYDETDLVGLREEFTGLVVSGYPSTPCKPYESVYRGSTTLVSEHALRVEEFYRRLGLVLDKEYPDLPEHIAVELDLMAILTSAGDPSYEEEARRFLREHLLEWGPLFADCVAERASNPFLREMALLLKELLEREGG